MKNIIYGLKCPFSGEIHYIGKSTSGLIRPTQHFSNSHSIKITEWVSDLKKINNRPEIEVLEELNDSQDLNMAERKWISIYINKGNLLLNESLIDPILIRKDLDSLILDEHNCEYKKIGKFISTRRKQVGITQRDFAEKIGVSLRMLRKIEQGQSNFMFDKLIYILSYFGCTLEVVKFN